MPAHGTEAKRARYSPDHSSLKTRMLAFVQSHGNAVRFDQFAQEYLLGDYGFYSTHVDMSSPSGKALVTTPSGVDPAYRTRLASRLSHVALSICQRCDERVLVVAEIGGGAGDLKREFVSQAAPLLTAMGRELNYVSIEPNSHHRQAQSIDNSLARCGTAQHTGLPSASVHLLLDEEVLDSLPFRIFSRSPGSSTHDQEGHVLAEGSELDLVWRHIERDALAAEFFEHSAPELSPSPIASFAPASWDYWRESARVLHPRGVRVSVDYSAAYVDLREYLERESPRCVLTHPYQRDLTHGIDFEFQTYLARRIGGFGEVSVMDMNSFLQSGSADSRESLFIGERGVLIAEK